MGCHLCPGCFGLSSHDAESETEFQRQVVSLGGQPVKSQDSAGCGLGVCLPYAKVYNVPGRCCGPLRSRAWWEFFKPMEV